MAKKHNIPLDLDAPVFVLGVASTEKIWRVIWNINQALELNLATSGPDVVNPVGQELYLDADTDPDFEYYFFENTDKSRKVPRIAREFRYWLTLKPRRSRLPDLAALAAKLRSLEHISLVADLSGEENIKSLLP